MPGLDKEGVFSIHAGPSSSAAITSNGRVFFWGSNKSNKFATFRPDLFRAFGSLVDDDTLLQIRPGVAE